MKRISLSILVLVVLVGIALGVSGASGGGQGDVVRVIPQEPLNGIPQEPIIITRTKPDFGPDAAEETFVYTVDR
jgi:hypothetical protein